MSLNSSEQILFDYVGSHPEEKRFWEDKVRSIAAETNDEYVAAGELDRELWRYFQERGEVTPPFREVLARHGRQRISLRNLAELWLRLWAPPRAKPKKTADENG